MPIIIKIPQFFEPESSSKSEQPPSPREPVDENKYVASLAVAQNETLRIKTHTAPSLEESTEEGQLTIDVYETKDKKALVVEAALAGAKEKDVDVYINRDSVTIKGKRERSETIEDKNYLYQECFWGNFSRSVLLPYAVDPDTSKAVFKNGILTITMQKLGK